MKIGDVLTARERLLGVIHATPLNRSEYFSHKVGANIFLKCEHQQKTGSYKVRGAYNKIAKLVSEQKVSSIVAASAGNHAQGVAFAAVKNNIKATIIMPQSTPLAKVLAVKGYGAEVILYGKYYDDAYKYARELESQMGAVFIHPFDDVDVMAGQGTVGLEILDELKNVDVIVCPVGGGGLISGVAIASKAQNPKVQIVGVQTEGAAAMVRSVEAERVVTLPGIYTIADGIAVKTPGSKTFKSVQQHVDKLVTVADDDIASVIIELLERSKQVVEPAGAASLAAVVGGKIDIKGKNVACILSGGNIDVGFIHKIIEKGLLKRGRQISLAILLQDAPGGLEAVSGIIARSNANVIGVRYDRTLTELQINDVVLHMTCEITGPEHGKKVVEDLSGNGFRVLNNADYK